MEKESNNNPAEKIRLLLQSEESRDSDIFLSGIDKINHRLNLIEKQILPNDRQNVIQNPKPFHPSQEKLSDLDELAVEVVNQITNEKACPFEPTGKPCDSCSMCNSLGF